MRKQLFLVGIIIILFSNLSFAQETPLIITDMKAEPATVSANKGDQVLISCQVNHAEGPMYVKKVAATVYQGEKNTGYPALFDDGTNGDAEPGDGIYSLAITASGDVGAAQIVFHAVDNYGNEIDSNPILLSIQ